MTGHLLSLTSAIYSLLVVSIEEGALYAVVALALGLSFRVVRFPDLTVDGSFAFGAAIAGAGISHWHSPWLSTTGAFAGGILSGLLTGAFAVKLKISRLLSGVLVMTMLYTIALRIMGRSNIQLLHASTVLSRFESMGQPALVAILCLFAATVNISIAWLLRTEFGLHLRASGEHPRLLVSLGRNPDLLLLFGLALSNGLIASSGAVAAQLYGFADVNIGVGTLVIGLACLYVGDSFAGKLSRPTFISRLLVAALGGSLAYQVARNLCLRVGFSPTDLKLGTALLVVAFMSLPSRNRMANEELPF